MNKLTLKSLVKTGDYLLNNSEIGVMCILIEAYGNAPELIINPRENIKSKLEYYSNAYNEDLTLKTNGNIKIIDYGFYDSLQDILNS